MWNTKSKKTNLISKGDPNCELKWEIKVYNLMWVLVNSTNNISDSWIRNRGLNSGLHQKPIDVLVIRRKKSRNRRDMLKLYNNNKSV